VNEIKSRFENLLDRLFAVPDDVFKEFLNIALKLWDYRVKGRRKKRGNPYGIEYIFQTYIVGKIWELLIEEINKGNEVEIYDLYFSESISKIVEQGKYEKEIFMYKTRCIQPDLVVVRVEREIQEICVLLEIKCIERGCLSWIFSSDGKEANLERGDISKLQRIKGKYPEISCYELVINRGKWDSSCWGNNYYEQLINENFLKESKIWEFSDELDEICIKLIEILG